MIPYARHDGKPMTPAQCAEWIGSDVGVMQAEHDVLHADLCEWLGVESQSLRVAAGQTLADKERELAELEEHAVLAVQRFRAHVRSARSVLYVGDFGVSYERPSGAVVDLS